MFCCSLSHRQQFRRFLSLSLFFNTANCISYSKEKRERLEKQDISFLGLPRSIEPFANICTEEQAVILPELLNAIKDGTDDLEAVYPTAKLQYNISDLNSNLALKRKWSPVITDRADKYITETPMHTHI